jgi:hypothetical protein
MSSWPGQNGQPSTGPSAGSLTESFPGGAAASAGVSVSGVDVVRLGRPLRDGANVTHWFVRRSRRVSGE